MNRRSLLRAVAALPVAGIAAAVGIKAAPAPTPTEFGKLHYLTGLNNGIVSRESAMEAFGLSGYERSVLITGSTPLISPDRVLRITTTRWKDLEDKPDEVG